MDEKPISRSQRILNMVLNTNSTVEGKYIFHFIFYLPNLQIL
jgi:hypothetical protein